MPFSTARRCWSRRSRNPNPHSKNSARKCGAADAAPSPASRHVYRTHMMESLMTVAVGITHGRVAVAVVAALGLSAVCARAQPADVYATYGVHNPPADSPCANADCIYVRQHGEPSDPHYPPYWSSSWNMYRVFQGYVENPPPYDGVPPPALKPGVDYEISQGATYYDSTWRGPTGEGAMMEHYEKRCLPIFPISNHFTCSFI